MRVVNAYTISPDEIQAGDVMLFVVKAMVIAPGVYRIYRCPYPHDEGQDIPQGSRISHETAVCEALFPSLAAVARADRG